MKIYAETERLILREMLEADVEGMYELDSDADVHRYLGNKPLTDINQSAEVIKIIRQQYVDNGIARWTVIEKATGNFIGWSGLKLMNEEANAHTGHYDLGYRFIKKYWGKGYATESAIAARDYAFNELKQDNVYGMADVANRGSRNVLEKVGMKFTNEFDYKGFRCAWYECNNQRK